MYQVQRTSADLNICRAPSLQGQRETAYCCYWIPHADAVPACAASRRWTLQRISARALCCGQGEGGTAVAVPQGHLTAVAADIYRQHPSESPGRQICVSQLLLKVRQRLYLNYFSTMVYALNMSMLGTQSAYFLLCILTHTFPRIVYVMFQCLCCTVTDISTRTRSTTRRWLGVTYLNRNARHRNAATNSSASSCIEPADGLGSSNVQHASQVQYGTHYVK
jgi:hypothetical protein